MWKSGCSLYPGKYNKSKIFQINHYVVIIAASKNNCLTTEAKQTKKWGIRIYEKLLVNKTTSILAEYLLFVIYVLTKPAITSEKRGKCLGEWIATREILRIKK